MEVTDEELDARIAALTAGEAGASPASPVVPPLPSYRYVKPLSAAANNLIDALRIEEGIGLGIADLDILTRGFRPSDLVIVTGFAHSGKTQLINQMIINNPERKVLFFSLDDPAEMILAKLIAMYTAIPSEQLEARVRANDEEVKAIIREAAEHTFQNLLVVDEVIGINAMQDAVAEATAAWGQPPDAVVVDYLEVMPGDGVSDDAGADVKAKANACKTWAKHSPYPVIVLHQGTRSKATPGDPITLLSMGFSGEQQATIVVGCRRKRDRTDLEAYERAQVEDTITVHIVKNKRPGGRCTHFEGVDLHMDAPTGLIRPLNGSERRQLFDPNSATARAERATQEAISGTQDAGRHAA